MIQLGSLDAGVPASACEAYLKHVEETTRLKVAEVAEGSDKLKFAPCVPDTTQPMTVAGIQQGTNPSKCC
jgi:hypothetical protein